MDQNFTSISKIDPFIRLNKIQVQYLDGYENIIVDPDAPLEIHEKPKAKFPSRLLKGIKKSNYTNYILHNSGGVRSVLYHHSISEFRHGGTEEQPPNSPLRAKLSSIQPDTYSVTLLITGIKEAVEDFYKNAKSAHNHEYLPSGVDEEAAMEEMEPPQAHLEDSESSTLFLNHSSGPILAVTQGQFRMIQALGIVGWRKFPVHPHKHRHSYASIIVRADKRQTPNFEEVRVVFRYWLDEEFIT